MLQFSHVQFQKQNMKYELNSKSEGPFQYGQNCPTIADNNITLGRSVLQNKSKGCPAKLMMMYFRQGKYYVLQISILLFFSFIDKREGGAIV